VATGRIPARPRRKTLRDDVSLAHHGVLFLDELPEFGIPCENRDTRARAGSAAPAARRYRITINRAQGSLTFPANFQLVGAMNP